MQFEQLVDFLYNEMQNGRNPDTVEWDYYEDLLKELGSKLQYVEPTYDPNNALPSKIIINGPYGPVVIIAGKFSKKMKVFKQEMEKILNEE